MKTFFANRKFKLALWEIGCFLWICFAGGLLHFAFELSEYWTPMALIAAVNESVWEHIKMYFWPGFAFALVQWTYSRNYSNNYWLGKAAALAITPFVIIISYEAYMAYAAATDIKPSLMTMLTIMFGGVGLGQFVSFLILSAPPMSARAMRLAPATFATLLFMFGTFTYFPPKLPLFENYACYTYTGEYGILDDYEPYRIFSKVDANGEKQEGLGVNYCETFKSKFLANVADPSDSES